MKMKNHTPKHAATETTEISACCRFHAFLRHYYQQVRDRNNDADRQLVLLAHILHAHIEGLDDQAIGIVFESSNCEFLGLGSQAETMAALKALADAGILDVTQVRADEQGHARGRELTVVSLPWLGQARP